MKNSGTNTTTRTHYSDRESPASADTSQSSYTKPSTNKTTPTRIMVDPNSLPLLPGIIPVPMFLFEMITCVLFE